MPLRPYFGRAGGSLITIAIAGAIVVATAIATSKLSEVLLLIGCAVLLIIGGVLFGLHVKSNLDPDREFADASPDEILKVANENTKIRAENLLRPYRGKWLKVSGPLSDVTPWHPFDRSALLTLSNYELTRGIYFYFNDKKVVQGRLSTLPKGAELTIIGRISGVDVHDITLKKCIIEAVVHTPAVSRDSGQV